MQMSEKYIRLTKTLTDSGVLIKPDEIEKNIQNPLIDHYTSAFYYTKEHFNQFKTTGTVAGIADVKTDKIWFDFDSKNDLKKARRDAIELVDRLKTFNIQSEQIEIFFSGNKGFNVMLHLSRDITPKQVEFLALHKFGKGLETLDPSLYNPSRILRVPGTKHQSTEYFKTPLTEEQLKKISFENLYKLATTPIKVIQKKVYLTLAEDLFEVPEVNEEAKSVALNEFDLNSKPRQWKASKWALMQGFFGPGERNQTAMILSATCKAMSYDKLTTYYMCKSAMKKSWERYGEGDFSKEELWSIIERTFEKDNIGQYSEKDDAFLQKKCDELGLRELTQTITVDIKGALKLFKGYAKNIDELTLKTGIKELDSKQRITVGMSWGIVAAPGSGKCLGKDTPIMMFDGSIKNVQDIIVGDKIMGDDSTPRTILSTCTGIEQLYKIHQENGNSYIVNESHILSLKGGASFNPKQRLKKYNYGTVHDIKLKDYLNGSKKQLKYFKGYKVPVEFKEQVTPLDPYLFGLWLGDGTSTKPQITIGKQDIELFSYLKSEAFRMNLSYSIVQDRQCYNFNFKKFKRNPGKNLVAKNIPENKVIPNEYLINSKENRLKLLAGLIDSDGHFDKKKSYYEIIQKNDKLSEQIVFLCRSLGFRTTIKKTEKYCYYKGEKRTGMYNRITFTAEDLTKIPVKLLRKKAKLVNKQRYHDLTKIKVEKLEIGQYYGFEIDGNRRFLLGDFTVTHNTSIALQIMHSMSKNNELCVFFSYDMFAPHVIQKIIQNHWAEEESMEFVFKKYKEGDEEYVKKVEDLIASEYPNVEFCFESGQTIDDIKQTIRDAEQKQGKKCRFVVIDYNELVISDVSDPTQSSNKTAQQIRALAVNEQLCILSLFQPNKQSGDPSAEIKSYLNAKGGGGIGQSVSFMLGVSRPGYDPRKPETDKFISLNVVKNRMGPIFYVDLHWNGYRGSVRSLKAEEYAELKRLRDEKSAENTGNDEW